MIAALCADGALASATPLDADQVQPASLDLRLGAGRLSRPFELPARAGTARVADRIETLKLHELDLPVGAVLERGCVYLVPLQESAGTCPPRSAPAPTPRCSTGRLDVFTRVIGDGARGFDTLPAGYAGPLYLEISPRTFPVLVRAGSRLSQMRFRVGDTRLTVAEHRTLHRPRHAGVRRQRGGRRGRVALDRPRWARAATG